MLFSMAEFNFSVLKNVDQLSLYQEQTAHRVGVELPMDYLQRARVIGLIDRDTTRLAGGFVMAYQGPLRCLAQIPEADSHSRALIDRYGDQCFEINGLWLDHHQAPSGSSFHLYMRCMQEAIQLSLSGKTKYVYAYSAENHKLRKFYQNFNSKRIYEGPIKPLPGLHKIEDEVVEMGCMKRLPLTVLRNPGFLVKRGLKGSGVRSLLGTLRFSRSS
jgi:hypothetical protein